MKKPKLKNSPPSTKDIFDALFEKLMLVATSNGQLIERNRRLSDENERLSKELKEAKEPRYREVPSIKPVSTLQVKGFWSDKDKEEIFGVKAE